MDVGADMKGCVRAEAGAGAGAAWGVRAAPGPERTGAGACAHAGAAADVRADAAGGLLAAAMAGALCMKGRIGGIGGIGGTEETGASGAIDAILTGGTTAATGSACLVAGGTGDETGIDAASAAFEAVACVSSPCVSGAPKRDAPRGAAGVAAATTTGRMSRR